LYGFIFTSTYPKIQNFINRKPGLVIATSTLQTNRELNNRDVSVKKTLAYMDIKVHFTPLLAEVQTYSLLSSVLDEDEWLTLILLMWRKG
jgi:hypothetical protein